MYRSVRNHFVEFNEPIEARVHYMYLDIKGLVTIGVGNLIDVENVSDTKKLEDVLRIVEKLPFIFKEGGPDSGKSASPVEIRAEWKKVKGRPDLAKKHYSAFAQITNLRLTNEAIDDLALTKADAMEAELMQDPAYAGLSRWPADAQLGLLSMAWALGAPKLKTHWPNFKSACQRQDFEAAAKHCEISTVGNPGVSERNSRNQRLFKNAANVLANESRNPAQNLMERQVLHYPHILMKKITVRG